jgi:DNA mismatch repair ATPase MutL
MDLQIMFEAYVMTHPPISFYLNKAGKSQVQIRECFSQPLKERLDEGGEAGEGKHLRGSIFYLFFIENEEDRGWSTVRVI